MAHQEPSGSPRVLRQLNRNHILRAIRASGPISRGDLAQDTGLSRPTVNEVIGDLLAEDIVEERVSDGLPARPGPRAKLVRFRGEAGYVLGVDVGATKAVVQLADLDGRIVATERADTGSVGSRADVLRIVRGRIDAVTRGAGVSLADIRAVGIGSPGVVDPETGGLSLAPQLPGWEGITLSEELDPRISAPIKAANEVHLAVLGERWQGAARDARDAVYLHIGVGIGLGILIDGKLHPGSSGAAGEIGYLPLPEQDPTRPAEVGALEYAASGAAFARRGRAAARRPGGARLTELAGGDPDAVDARTVFQAVAEGDVAATEIRDELIELLARTTAAVCLVLDPTTVILGGGLSQAGTALAAPLEQHVRQLVPIPPRIEVSELGDLAVTYGAVRLALDHVDAALYGVDGNDEAQRKATA